MTHIVNKQLIHLKIATQKDAFRIQHLLSDHYWKELVPLLKTCLDACTNEEELLYLDQLEIDLGNICMDELEQTAWDHFFLQRMEKMIKEQLITAIGRQQRKPEKRVLGIARQWLFYMEKGYLYWNTLHADAAWQQQVLEALAVDIDAVTSLRQLLVSNEHARWRIVLQHDAIFLQHLVAAVTAQRQSQLALAIDELVQLEVWVKEEMQQPGIPITVLQQQCWQQVLWRVALAPQQQATENIIRFFLEERLRPLSPVLWEPLIEKQHWPLLQQLLQQQLVAAKTAGHPAESYPVTKPGSLQENAEEGAPVAGASRAEEPLSAENTGDQDVVINTGGMEDAGTLHNTVATAPGKIATKEQEDPMHSLPPYTAPAMIPAFDIDEADTVFVSNAGLVLIHPFLHQLMKRLQLVAEKKFVSTAAQQKAVLLLHYLATGETAPQEHALVIPKLLCNHALQLPVLPQQLDDAELVEAEDLLAAVIQQWDKIKNTSVAALREGFLQRKGKLYKKQDQLFLRVESGAIDVLLDYLPWGWNINTVMLPWLKEIIKVEWRT